MPKTAALSGPDPELALPDGAIDCGDGYYILQDYEGNGDVRYRSCPPGGKACRFTNDLWQAEIYMRQIKEGRIA